MLYTILIVINDTEGTELRFCRGIRGRYLVCEQHHEGVAPGGRGRVLHRERVVVVFDDVEVDVSLGWSHDSSRTLYPDTHIA